jgi:hypothetical protein
MPIRPSTTLGIAASISTSGPTMTATRRGAMRARNSPIDTPRIVARITAEDARDQRSVDVRQGAELAGDWDPRLVHEEPEAELVERPGRAVDHLVGDQEHRDEDEYTADPREPLQRPVGTPVEPVQARPTGPRGGGGVHRRLRDQRHRRRTVENPRAICRHGVPGLQVFKIPVTTA